MRTRLFLGAIFALLSLSLQVQADGIQINPNETLPSLYQKIFKNYYMMIFSDLPSRENKVKYDFPSLNIGQIIHNNDSYMVDEHGNQDVFFEKMDQMVEGKPLFLKNYEYHINGVSKRKDIPTGYNIFVPQKDANNIFSPQNKIKGVVVEVYAGFNKNVRASVVQTPTSFSPASYYLINQGIVVIRLNLIDLLDNNDDQLEISEHIQTMIHASIHQLYLTLRNENESKELFAGFSVPKDTKIYLLGQSYGGLTTVNHAEHYPNTYDGYISDEGMLSLEMVDQSDILAVKGRRGRPEMINEARKWLNPVNNIRAIKQPILLLHNFDDNNVNIKVSLDFYKRALEEGKGNLVQLFITRRGAPVSHHLDAINKGHFPSEDEQAFKTYAETIASFIINGPSPFPSTSKWMVHQYEIYANKNYRSATLEEWFISEAYRLYKRIENPNFDTFWNDTGHPLYYMIAYLHSMKPEDINKFNKESLQAELAIFKNPRMLTDNVITQTVLHQLPGFFEYIVEYLQPKSDLPEITNDTVRDPHFINQFKEFLFSDISHPTLNDIAFKIRLLQDLYTSNPELIHIRIKQLYGEKIPEALHQAAEEAKKNLQGRIDLDKEYARKEWHAAVKKLGKPSPEMSTSTHPRPPFPPTPPSPSTSKSKTTNKKQEQEAVPPVSSPSLSEEVKTEILKRKPPRRVLPSRPQGMAN